MSEYVSLRCLIGRYLRPILEIQISLNSSYYLRNKKLYSVKEAFRILNLNFKGGNHYEELRGIGLPDRKRTRKY